MNGALSKVQVETNYFASFPENVCAFNLSFSTFYTFSLETSNLKEVAISKISKWDSAPLYCGTSVSASFESCSFWFFPATSISASTCKCVRNKERRRDENPPGWNECSCVAPSPHPLQSVTREGNPWMGLSQVLHLFSPLGRAQSQKDQHPLPGCPPFAESEERSCFQI